MSTGNEQDQYEGRRARMAEMLDALGRGHNEFSPRELGLMQDACDAAHDRFAPPSRPEPVAPDDGTSSMPRVGGKRFFCTECGAGVFTRRGSIYTCNGCQAEFEGS